MSSVAYQQCPCGSGKKIKFCCSKDLAADLEKILESVQADQRMAALQALGRLRKSKGDRPAVLALQAQIQMELRDAEGATQTIEKLREVEPGNAIGLALDAQLHASRGEVAEGTELLQTALGQCEEAIPLPLWHTIGALTAVWSMVGNIAAARGHAWLRLSLSQSQDEQAGEDFIRLISNKEFPILLRQTDMFPDPPESAHWFDKFEQAEKPLLTGHIAGAIENLTKLDAEIPEQPAIEKRLAIYNDWLGRRDEGRKYRQKYAANPNVSSDDAIEAEALVLMNSVESHGVEQVRRVYEVEDINLVLAKLQSEPTAKSVETENEANEHGAVKASFMLLTGEPPESIDSDTPFESIPEFLANVLLYGKTTERPALVEFIGVDASEFAQANRAFESMLGEMVGEKRDESRQVALTQDSAMLRVRKYLDPAEPEVARKFHEQFLEEVITKQWPETARNDLGGKTPQDAANDPTLKRRLNALLLNLEFMTEKPDSVAKLREKLGLEKLPKVTVADVEAARDIPAVRLVRLDLSMNDEVLTTLWNRAVSHAFHLAVAKIGKEIIQRRPLLAEELGETGVIRQLVRCAADPDEADNWINKGLANSAKKGEPQGLWKIQKMQVSLAKNDPTQFTELMNDVQKNHINEQGVRETLFQLLHSLGLIRADGRPTMAPQNTGQPMKPAQSAAEVWSPDTPKTPATQSPPPAEKPGGKLWLPGQE